MTPKNKNTLQGMEHLKKQLNDAQLSDTSILSEKTPNVLKKELITIFLIMSFLFLILIGLMVFDKSGRGLDNLASKIVLFSIN